MRACVDIGGTKVAVSLSPSSDAPLVGRRSEPTAKTGDNDAVAVQIMRMIDEVCAEQGIAPADIDRVGVSSTGPFELRDGIRMLRSRCARVATGSAAAARTTAGS